MSLKIPKKWQMTCCKCGVADEKSIQGPRFECTTCGYTIHIETNAVESLKKFAREDKRTKDKFNFLKESGGEVIEGTEVVPVRTIDKFSDVKDLKVGDRITYNNKKISPRKRWEEE